MIEVILGSGLEHQFPDNDVGFEPITG